MATTARLGIDIVGHDRTKAAFAGAERSMAGLTRHVGQMKVLMAGFVGGNLLEGMVRSFVNVAKQSAPVKTALDNMALAWNGFAQKVGEGGLNQALINFANRIGALILGTDGLAKSIGAFMAGAINIMGAVFEGVGRAIAFAYDNAEIFMRFIAAMALVAFGQRVIGVAAAFYFFAKTIRQTGIIMSAFNAISKANLLVFLALAAGIAYATDSVDQLKAGIETMWAKVKDIFPMIAETGKSAMEGLGFDMSALSSDLADTSKYLDRLGEVNVPMTEKIGKAAAKTKELGVTIEGLRGPATAFKELEVAGSNFGEKMQEVGGSIIDGLVSPFMSFVQGTITAADAFEQMKTSLLSTLSDLTSQFLKAGLSGLLNFGGTQLGGAQGLGGFGGFYAEGGRLGAGKKGIAGENGPEWIDGPAGITPMSAIPARSGGGGSNQVIVHNYNGGEVEQRERRNASGGMTTEIFFRKMLDKTLPDANRRAVPGAFGVPPSLINR